MMSILIMAAVVLFQAIYIIYLKSRERKNAEPNSLSHTHQSWENALNNALEE